MKNAAVSMAPAKVEAPRVAVKEGTYKIASTTLMVTTNERTELKVITEQVAEFVSQTPIKEGIVQISSLHTTAGVMVNETQDALLDDMKDMFEQAVPASVYYRHNDPELSDCARRNADAHLRLIMVGNSATVPLEAGKMKMGTYQQIFFTEFDGPNNRKVHVQVMGI